MQLGVLEVSKCHWPAGSTGLVGSTVLPFFLSPGQPEPVQLFGFPPGRCASSRLGFFFILCVFFVDLLAIIAYI
jgi:hypothetical protein